MKHIFSYEKYGKYRFFFFLFLAHLTLANIFSARHLFLLHEVVLKLVSLQPHLLKAQIHIFSCLLVL